MNVPRNLVIEINEFLRKVGEEPTMLPHLAVRASDLKNCLIAVSKFPDNNIEPALVNETTVTRSRILEEAIQCVTKDRNDTHGDPEDNFDIISRFWTDHLINRGLIHGTTERGLNCVDVAAMMILMKISRTYTSPRARDHWVDIAGYAACGGEIACK